MFAAWLMASMLAACSQGTDIQPPKPTENPSPHLPESVKVTVPDDFKGSLVASASWIISNHACAPKIPIAGAYREEPVNRPAGIRREGSSYFLTAFTDQYLMDECHWIFAGFDIRMYENGVLVGTAGMDGYLLKKLGGRVEIICDPDPHVPYCVTADVAKRTFLKLSSNRKVFAFTIEGA